MTDFKKRPRRNFEIKPNLIDSSIWISYFFEGKFKEEIEQEEIIFISPISIYEIKLKLIKKEVPAGEIKEKMNFIKMKTISIKIDEKIAEKAAEISHEHKLHTAEALIYSSALSKNAALLTLDKDFRGLPDIFLKE